MAHQEKFGVYLLSQPGIEPSTPPLMADLFYHLTYSSSARTLCNLYDMMTVLFKSDLTSLELSLPVLTTSSVMKERLVLGLFNVV